MSDEKIFANGLIIKRHPNAPDFVICNLSVKVGEFTAFLHENAKDSWVNLQVKQAKTGKYYAELDTYTPNRGQQDREGMAQTRAAMDAPRQETVPPFEDDALPF